MIEPTKVECRYFETDYGLPGWGCCKCNVYNGAWREFCRQCKHPVCITLPADKVAESTAMAAAHQGLAVPSQDA